MNNFDLDKFVREGIVNLFDAAAEKLAEGMELEDTQGIPLAMFEAQEHMLQAWKQFLMEKAGEA